MCRLKKHNFHLRSCHFRIPFNSSCWCWESQPTRCLQCPESTCSVVLVGELRRWRGFHILYGRRTLPSCKRYLPAVFSVAAAPKTKCGIRALYRFYLTWRTFQTSHLVHHSYLRNRLIHVYSVLFTRFVASCARRSDIDIYVYVYNKLYLYLWYRTPRLHATLSLRLRHGAKTVAWLEFTALLHQRGRRPVIGNYRLEELHGLITELYVRMKVITFS